jgi:hypothetical protein
MNLSIDEAHRILKRLGWSVGDVAVDDDRGRVWIVQCVRGSFSFTAEAHTQTEAWARACQTAEAMDN